MGVIAKHIKPVPFCLGMNRGFFWIVALVLISTVTLAASVFDHWASDQPFSDAMVSLNRSGILVFPHEMLEKQSETSFVPSPVCGQTVTTGNGMLYQDLWCAGQGVTITGSNIILDCHGFSLHGNNQGTGITITNAENVTVANCGIHNFAKGVEVTNSRNVTFYGNTFNNVNNIESDESLVKLNYSWRGNDWSDFESNAGYPDRYIVNAAIADEVPAESTVSCGQTLFENTILTEDLFDCPQDGLYIGANDVTLNCNGHTIGNLRYGVDMTGVSNVVVKNCNIQNVTGGIGAGFGSNNIQVIYNNLTNVTATAIVFQGVDTLNASNNIITNSGSGALGFAGIYLSGSVRSNIINNRLKNLNATGITITGSSANGNVSSNILLNNSASAYESAAFMRWYVNGVGNYWSDFESNAGYPMEYQIPGPGSGVDLYPLNLIAECEHDADCDNGLYCDGQERCVNFQCQQEGAIDCSANNVIIDTCNYDPDNNPKTKDVYEFISSCDEGDNQCTQATPDPVHTCDLTCGASCVSNKDCSDGNTVTEDRCTQNCGCVYVPRKPDYIVGVAGGTPSDLYTIIGWGHSFVDPVETKTRLYKAIGQSAFSLYGEYPVFKWGTTVVDDQANISGQEYRYYATSIADGVESTPTSIVSITVPVFTCTDTDVDAEYLNGANPYLQGNLSGNIDSCEDQFTVREYYCGLNDNVQSQLIECRRGFCSEGACVAAAASTENRNILQRILSFVQKIVT